MSTTPQQTAEQTIAQLESRIETLEKSRANDQGELDKALSQLRKDLEKATTAEQLAEVKADLAALKEKHQPPAGGPVPLGNRDPRTSDPPSPSDPPAPAPAPKPERKLNWWGW